MCLLSHRLPLAMLVLLDSRVCDCYLSIARTTSRAADVQSGLVVLSLHSGRGRLRRRPPPQQQGMEKPDGAAHAQK